MTTTRRPLRWPRSRRVAPDGPAGLPAGDDALLGRAFTSAEGPCRNGYRSRAWKQELQRFADRTRLTIEVSHFPPGTSVDPRRAPALRHITANWRGTPLTTCVDRNADGRRAPQGGNRRQTLSHGRHGHPEQMNAMALVPEPWGMELQAETPMKLTNLRIQLLLADSLLRPGSLRVSAGGAASSRLCRRQQVGRIRQHVLQSPHGRRGVHREDLVRSG